MSDSPVERRTGGTSESVRSRRPLRVGVAVIFWLLQAWWAGSVVYALISLDRSDTFRVYSVLNDEVREDGWGLTFPGEAGQVLAVSYLLLLTTAYLGLFAGGRLLRTWSSLLILGWATLFAGNSLWLETWKQTEWWDVVNYVGLLVVITFLIPRVLQPGPALRDASV